MSRIHVLGATGNNLYQIVVHGAAPAGNNAAGVAWSAALIGAGFTTSVLPTGTGAGQIDPTELAQIQAGTLIEGVFGFGDDPSQSAAQRLTALDAAGTQTLNELSATIQAKLKYFGLTRT